MSGDITLEQIISVCGNYTNKSGNNYYFRCPICYQEGHDEHGDNLVFNEAKNIIKCFAGDNHASEILREINKKFKTKKEDRKPKVEVIKQWELNREKYLEYALLTNEYLLNNQELLDYIKQKRGFNKKIVEICGFGYDYTENSFILPVFSLKYDCIIDFELRKKSDKKQIKRVGGGCNTIARIYGCNKSKTLYITEGFIDGYTLTQYLLEKKQKDFTIYSCSNGVSSLINVLSEINFNNFKEIKLILDNDKAGNEATFKIIEKYPFIKDSREFLVKENVKDINDWYKRKVK